MLSLSLFCSSQTISVALYDRRILKKFLYKKINNTGIESIFKLIKNCFEGENIKGLSNIFFLMDLGVLRLCERLDQS